MLSGFLRRHGAMLFWLLVVLLACWAYWPGTAGPRMLDDYSSLSVLAGLTDAPGQSSDYVFGDRSGPLGRPVSMASFVLEKLYLGDGVAVSKKLNILLHAATGCLVVWLLLLLLRMGRIPGHRWLAVLAGAAWLLSPLYVSTVLYAVQRMAMLAAFFSLACAISYLYWRLALMRGRAGLLPLISALVFAVLAVYSKENAIVVLPILLLVEVFWLRYEGAGGVQLAALRRLSWVCIWIAIVGALAFSLLGMEWLEGRYARREFSLHERVLTQTRVLWDYVRQLVWPDVRRMGLQHDDLVVSTAIAQPASTLYAIVGWVAVLLASAVLSLVQWGRYLVFAVAFFLVAHGVESTVWPLELYFEHRNYLPGVGLFLLLAVVCGLLIRRWPEVRVPLLTWFGVYVLYLLLQTSSQVQVWSSRPLLYLNNVNAHPLSFRANADMAGHLASLGELDLALEYSAKAYEASLRSQAIGSERPGDQLIRDFAISCLANSPLHPGRIATLGAVKPRRPLAIVSNIQALVKLLQSGTCPELDWIGLADQLARVYLSEGHQASASAKMFSALAALENALQRYDNAYQYNGRYLELVPHSVRGLLMQLHFATALGKSGEAGQLKARLRRLDEAGKLSAVEQENLSLYL